MLRPIRDRLTYANVMATLAVFIALGGSSYAIVTVGSREIRDNSVRSRDLRNNDVRGKDVRNHSLSGADIKRDGIGGLTIKESTLGKVPSADRLGGLTAGDLRVRCPAGTVLNAGVCIEPSSSAPASFLGAGDQCSLRGRLLPSYVQLRQLVATGQFPLGAGGEFTSDVYEGGSVLRVVTVTNDGGDAGFQDALTPATKRYRCVAPWAN